MSGAVFADVTSANVVGYQEIETNAGATDFTMLTPTFLSVASDKDCTLADLKVTGYTGETKGDFVLRTLNVDGSSNKQYYWVETASKTAGWYASKLGSAIPGGPESVAIDAGQGLWCTTKGYKLVPCGAVGQSLIEYETNSGDSFTAVGNCTPVDITLDKLTVTGYAGETKGDFVLRTLNVDGSSNKQYYWVETASKTAGWYASKLGSAIPGGPESVTIKAGQGLWCSGKGLTLNIPSAIK